MQSGCEKLREFIKKGTSPWHVVAESAAQLEAAGYRQLNWNEEWKLQRGKAYYLLPFRTTLIAFRVHEECGAEHQLRVISSHVDSPGLRIKANAEYPFRSYRRINTEVYGGPINHTWMDRPLGMSGIVMVKGQEGRPEICYLDCGRPLFIIPNLSIHMNRDMNKGMELNPQVDLIPLGGIHIEKNLDINAKSNVNPDASVNTDTNISTEGKSEIDTNSFNNIQECFFTQFLVEELSRTEGKRVTKEDIISYDLGLYIMQEGIVCGMAGELFAAPRLDNLTSVQASITALIESSRTAGLDVIALFDHEEIGSRSKNGGGGNLLPFTLERIYEALGMSRGDYLRNVGCGFLLSADAAHALNPNHPEKYDPTSAVLLGEGVAIKCASRQNYAGDGEIWAFLKMLGEANKIPCKFTYNRSDIPGGGTLGSILSAILPMRSADIGVPLLAMHSAMETMCSADQNCLERYLKAFLSQDVLR